jgi:hypothetical protein
MTIFSGSMPATKLAIAGFDPLFLTARAALAGLLGRAVPVAMPGQRPRRATSPPWPSSRSAWCSAFRCSSALAAGPALHPFHPLSRPAAAGHHVRRAARGRAPIPAFWAGRRRRGLVCGFAAHRGAAGSWARTSP